MDEVSFFLTVENSMNQELSIIVRQKTKALIRKRGVTVTRLGEVLGSKNDRRSKYSMGERFLSGRRKVSLRDIERLADFFEKPLTYFITPGSKTPPGVLRQPELEEEVSGETEIRIGLKRMGFSDDMIEIHVTYLKQMARQL